jgi:8-oxo-dGTP pyrophosphatase MutT (NUDIX family)
MSHIHDLIDFTVEAFIVHKGKVLLVHHKKLQKWLPAGGHIELDENPEQALFREIKEETGLGPDEIEVVGERFPLSDPDVKSLYPPSFLDIHKISNTHRHIGLGYIVKASTGRVTLADGEHSEIRYFTIEELLNPQFAVPLNVQQYAKHAIEVAYS